ncbi:hypothetical protein E3N88_31394 [Mikania micrantha]|uniref:Uncharacterized protein n=1 Tax=Mikania micrantha TaxID=192012 RepID=A0A5N6MPG6_9ASTR|nr:hypothetical protein E3N88_31394 [Mikania micrantha]
MGGYVTHIARRLGVFGADVEATMTARYRPERVLQQQPPHKPQHHREVRASPTGVPLQPPPRGHRLVFRDPVLRDQSRRLYRLEDLAAWQSEVVIAVATHLGVQIPPLPQPRQYPDNAGASDDARGGDDARGCGGDA